MDPSGGGCEQILEALASALLKTISSIKTVRPVLENHVCSNTLSEKVVTRLEFLKDSLQDCTENNNCKEASAIEQLRDCDTSSSQQSSPRKSHSNKYMKDVDDFIQLLVSEAVEDGNNAVNLLSDEEEEKENPNKFKQERESSSNSEVVSFSDMKTEGIKADDERVVLGNGGNLSRQVTRDKLLDKSSKEQTTSKESESCFTLNFQNQEVGSLYENSLQMVASSKIVKHKKTVKDSSATKQKGSIETGLKPKLSLDLQCRLSPEMASLLGHNILTRKQAFKALWNYVRNSCTLIPDTSCSKKVICDRNLREVLKKEETSYAKLHYMIFKTRKYMFEIESVVDSGNLFDRV